MCAVRNTILGIVAVFSVSASATTPVYQINETTGAYLQTVVSHDIYRYSANDDLRDVVVIDNQGNKLPHRIITPNAEITEKSATIPVRFFPVAVGATPETLLALSSASIRLDDNAISVSVEKTTNEALLDKAAPVDFYVVDISELKTHADSLTVDWQINESNQYLEVDVSGTNDLHNWTNIAQSTLVQLQKEGQSLIRNTIALDLSVKKYAYLRLKFIRGGDNLQLTQMAIHNRQQQLSPVVTDIWQLRGSLAKNQTSVQRASGTISGASVAAWEFIRDDIAPTTRINIDLGTSTYGDSLKVFSRAKPKDNWHLVYQGIWFNAQVGGVWQQSDAFTVYSNSDSYWRVELNELVRTTVNPTLVFHRQPQTLQFIANNAAPYSIAIDDKVSAANQNTSEQILSQLISGKDIVWTTVTFTELNPDMNSFAQKMTRMNWRTFLFWTILLTSLGVLVGVVIRLLKQIKSVES